MMLLYFPKIFDEFLQKNQNASILKNGDIKKGYNRFTTN